MRRFFKWAGVALGAVVLLLLVLVAAGYFVGSSKLSATYAVQTAALTVEPDSATLARGVHLVNINGCRDCHGEDLSGKVMVDEPPFRISASNLTSGAGGIGDEYTAEDFDRAIRHGIKKSGLPVFIMPSAAFHGLSNEDAAAIIAYVQQIPPVDNMLPTTEVRVPGRLLVAAAQIDPTFEVRTEPARSTPAPEAGPTAEYGEYLASITCQYCHGSDLRGGVPPMPDAPPAPDLAAAGQWTLEEFKHALRTGERPSGKAAMDPEFMPIGLTNKMTDADLEALHSHLAELLNSDA